jgi:hypothetical protein
MKRKCFNCSPETCDLFAKCEDKVKELGPRTMRILLRKSVEGHNNLFQWSPNGKNWYPINYRNIQPIHNGAPNPLKALEPFRNAMTKMRAYPGSHIVVFEGSYDLEKKILKVASAPCTR